MRIAVALCCVVAGELIFMSGPAFAAISHVADPWVVGLNGEHIRFDYTSEGAGWSSGGPFSATLFHADGTVNVWQTFCVEAGRGREVFYPRSIYKVWQTDSHVAVSTGNYVTDAAKWVYYQSLHNPSLLVGYTPGNRTSDSELQQAIWLGVCTAGGLSLGMPHDTAADTWFAAALAATDGGRWAAADLVWVLSPAALGYSGHGAQAQSMLYELPEHHSQQQEMPEPASLALWSVVGVAGFLVGRERRRKKRAG